MSVQAFAKLVGRDPAAIRRAIKIGRLVRALVWVDEPGKKRPVAKITDPELAALELGANTRPRGDATPIVAAPEPSGAAGKAEEGGSYADIRRRRELELWRQARIKSETDELELARVRGELVSATEARAAVAERFTVVRTKLLAVPARVKQRLPHLSPADVRVIDDLVREALEDLATGGGQRNGRGTAH